MFSLPGGYEPRHEIPFSRYRGLFAVRLRIFPNRLGCRSRRRCYSWLCQPPSYISHPVLAI